MRRGRPYLGRHGFRPCRLPGHVPALSGDLAVPGPQPTPLANGDRHATDSGPVLPGWSRDPTTLARVLDGLRRLQPAE
ncbi:hypothetical protein SAMN04487904_11327 [Actinopolyspora lacussalsi subsp. righensis]|uniref:Uncharacterized protein n=1 Tax=Actinopolyspora righensis TaxID=995060 RepID=A0A1I7BWD8_9ACTN|nr:hypothetical protein SAMN04487904_11327 [Actinopolyspora righensis]